MHHRSRSHRAARALALCAGACLVALTGCASYGTKVDQRTLLELQPGVTTCLEIRERYGPPTSATLTSDHAEQLTYTYAQTQIRAESFVPIVSMFVRGADTEQTTVTFECDTKGLLASYTSNQGQVGMGSGFVSGGKQK